MRRSGSSCPLSAISTKLQRSRGGVRMPPPAIDIKALRKNYDVQGGGAYEVSSIASKSCDVLNNTSSSKDLSLDSRSDRQAGFRRSPFGTCRSNARADLI